MKMAKKMEMWTRRKMEMGSSKMEMGKEMTGGGGGVQRYEERESNNRNAETDLLELH
jgi:hypothetical protein